MKLPTSLVAVKKINSNLARSSFSAEEIEKAARLFIDVEGVINPIILKRISLESYEVVDGHFEYYAAARAREISPLKGEMIQAIILEPENEKTLLDQIHLLRNNSNSATPSVDNGSNLEFRFANLEKIFKSQFDELRKDNRNLERSIAEIHKKNENLKQLIDLQESINDLRKIVDEIHESVKNSRHKKKSTEELKQKLRQNPLDLNSASASELITVPGIGQATVLQIIERRTTKGSFTSVEELSEIERVTRKIIDKHQWREFFVIRSSNA